MTEDQISQLSGLARDMEHVIKAVEEIKRSIGHLATKSELSALVSTSAHESLKFRVDTLERRVADQSASSVMTKVTRVAVMITAVGAAVGLVGALFLHFAKA